MKIFIKAIFGIFILIGALVIGASLWGIYAVSNMTPGQIARANSEVNASAGDRLKEACEKEVGYRGEDEVQRCQAKIIGAQVDARLKADKVIEDEEIDRARDSLN